MLRSNAAQPPSSFCIARSQRTPRSTAGRGEFGASGEFGVANSEFGVACDPLPFNSEFRSPNSELFPFNGEFGVANSEFGVKCDPWPFNSEFRIPNSELFP